MSHRTSTTVTHWIDLDDRERFDFPNHNRTITYRALRLTVQVVDGSVSSIDVTGARLLKDGRLSSGTIRKNVWERSAREALYSLLNARGIKTPTAVSA